jgi:hypothetical protein
MKRSRQPIPANQRPPSFIGAAYAEESFSFPCRLCRNADFELGEYPNTQPAR